MNKNLKHALQMGFEPPEPTRQKEFLSRLNAPKSTRWDFFTGQIGYIRKRVWLFSASIVITFLLFAAWGEQRFVLNGIYPPVWVLSALVPFIALLTVTELSRSASYGMTELELSCRYSLSHVTMARAAILGMTNFILLILPVLITAIRTEYSIFLVCMHIFTPYLLTCGASLFAINHINGRESIYCCAVVACAVSSGGAMLSITKQALFETRYIGAWAVLCLFSLLVLTGQGHKFIKATEEVV